jgi:hypothetical protein
VGAAVRVLVTAGVLVRVGVFGAVVTVGVGEAGGASSTTISPSIPSPGDSTVLGSDTVTLVTVNGEVPSARAVKLHVKRTLPSGISSTFAPATAERTVVQAEPLHPGGRRLKKVSVLLIAGLALQAEGEVETIAGSYVISACNDATLSPSVLRLTSIGIVAPTSPEPIPASTDWARAPTTVTLNVPTPTRAKIPSLFMIVLILTAPPCPSRKCIKDDSKPK